MTHNIPKIKVSYSHHVPASQRAKITNSTEAFEMASALYDKDTIEHIETSYMIVMNRANKVLGVAEIGSGGTTACIMDIKVIMQILLETNASAFIIVHNHPSGNAKPSDNDIKITKQIKEASKLYDIDFLDHLIITPEADYYSFSKECAL